MTVFCENAQPSVGTQGRAKCILTSLVMQRNQLPAERSASCWASALNACHLS